MEIVGEVGSNWELKADCFKSIEDAKKCGADAVKFQLFTHDDLFGYGYKTDSLKSLPEQWIGELSTYAEKHSIEFMCTPFSVSGIDKLNPFVKRFKLASSNLNHVPMLERLNSIGKPVIISTGGHTMKETQLAVNVLKDCDVTVMYCVSEYPARYINFAKLSELQASHDKVGYSDHSIDILNIPMIAQVLGATILEKHVNFTHWTNTADAPHSLSKDEFELMIMHLKGKEIPLDFNEDKMRTHHNVRCVAKRDIKKGEKLEFENNYGFYRSKRFDIFGINPFDAHLIDGKITTRAFARGDGLGPSGVE